MPAPAIIASLLRAAPQAAKMFAGKATSMAQGAGKAIEGSSYFKNMASGMGRFGEKASAFAQAHGGKFQSYTGAAREGAAKGLGDQFSAFRNSGKRRSSFSRAAGGALDNIFGGSSGTNFLKSDLGGVFESQITQKFASGVLKIPEKALGMQMGMAKLGMKGALLGAKLGNPVTLGTTVGGNAAALGFGAAGLAAGGLGRAGELSGSASASIIGGGLSEASSKVASSFRAIAKNPIKPSNWAALADAVASLPMKITGMGEAALKASEGLAGLDPGQTQAVVTTRLRDLRRNFAIAGKTGDTTKELAESIAGLKDAMAPLQATLTNISNFLLTQVANFMASALRILNFHLTAVEGMYKIATYFKDKATDTIFTMTYWDEIWKGWKAVSDAEKGMDQSPLNSQLRLMAGIDDKNDVPGFTRESLHPMGYGGNGTKSGARFAQDKSASAGDSE